MTHPSDKDDKENDLPVESGKFSVLDKLSAPNTARNPTITPMSDSTNSQNFAAQLMNQDEVLIDQEL